MTTRLEQAFVKASKLPRTEQNALADWLPAELESICQLSGCVIQAGC